jgi:hypothetical protein
MTESIHDPHGGNSICPIVIDFTILVNYTRRPVIPAVSNGLYIIIARFSLTGKS